MEITTPDIDSNEIARASFDLTDFGSKEVFISFLREFGLTENEEYEGDGSEWHGFGGAVVMHTYCNPITGQKSIGGLEPEPGFASYIHIHGSEERVSELYDAVHAGASFVKGSSSSEWIV